MGFLDFLFGSKSESTVSNQPQQVTGAPAGAAKVRVIEKRGKRTWLYDDEALKLDDYHGLTTWRSIRASAGTYFQDDLAAIDADTISVRVIDQRSAYLPGDWTHISDDQYAIVSDDNIALSLAYKDKLSDAGISEGDYVTCALSRPPHSNELALYILLTEQQDEAIEEAKALRSMRRRTGMDLPAGSDCVSINIDDDKWPLPDMPGRTYRSVSHEETCSKRPCSQSSCASLVATFCKMPHFASVWHTSCRSLSVDNVQLLRCHDASGDERGDDCRAVRAVHVRGHLHAAEHRLSLPKKAPPPPRRAGEGPRPSRGAAHPTCRPSGRFLRERPATALELLVGSVGERLAHGLVRLVAVAAV